MCPSSGCLRRRPFRGQLGPAGAGEAADLVGQVPVDVLLVYSPDRLARKYAYQALLIEEFAKAGTSVMFVKGPRCDCLERHCWCSSRA